MNYPYKPEEDIAAIHSILDSFGIPFHKSATKRLVDFLDETEAAVQMIADGKITPKELETTGIHPNQLPLPGFTYVNPADL